MNATVSNLTGKEILPAELRSQSLFQWLADSVSSGHASFRFFRHVGVLLGAPSLRADHPLLARANVYDIVDGLMAVKSADTTSTDPLKAVLIGAGVTLKTKLLIQGNKTPGQSGGFEAAMQSIAKLCEVDFRATIPQALSAVALIHQDVARRIEQSLSITEVFEATRIPGPNLRKSLTVKLGRRASVMFRGCPALERLIDNAYAYQLAKSALEQCT